MEGIFVRMKIRQDFQNFIKYLDITIYELYLNNNILT